MSSVNIAEPLPFLKMHGLGNDFVIIDGRLNALEPSVNFLRALSDRKRGVGCDQIIVLREPISPEADVKIAIYNADGSQINACGNATRCIAQIMFAELNSEACVIETNVALLKAWQEAPLSIAVDFGKPLLDWEQIPLASASNTLSVPVSFEGLENPCCVNMGNPHAVFFVPEIESVNLEKVGSPLEHDPFFPEQCNIEIAQILSPDLIRMRVWERGTGITEACGSGACATLVAAVRKGLSARRATIALDGGNLVIEWRADDHVIMIGPASLSYKGVLDANFGIESFAA